VINFEEFKKLDIRIATVLEAERVQGSRNLIKMQIDLGELGHRQIVAGIAGHYSPEELVGKQIVVLANLKPAVFMGQRSEGMLLAAETGKQGDPNYRVVLLVPEQKLPSGTPVH